MEGGTGQPPKTWLLESILVTILCCLPLGIVGIIQASRVETRYYAGDIAGAKRASDEAGKWTKIGAIAGVVGVLLYIIFIVIIGVAGAGDF
jgi:hypothetical protein